MIDALINNINGGCGKVNDVLIGEDSCIRLQGCTGRKGLKRGVHIIDPPMIWRGVNCVFCMSIVDS